MDPNRLPARLVKLSAILKLGEDEDISDICRGEFASSEEIKSVGLKKCCIGNSECIYREKLEHFYNLYACKYHMYDDRK